MSDIYSIGSNIPLGIPQKIEQIVKLQNRIAQLEERNSGLEAARIAYAGEFALNSEGEPDVGSIHQNIRKLKADYAQLEADLEDARKDHARYQWIQDWLESSISATPAFCKAVTRSEYDQAIDAAIKEQGK